MQSPLLPQRVYFAENILILGRLVEEDLVALDEFLDSFFELVVSSLFRSDERWNLLDVLAELRGEARVNELRGTERKQVAYLESTITISLESSEFLLVNLDLNCLILPQPFDLVQYFRVASDVCLLDQFREKQGRVKRLNQTHSLASKMSSNFFLRAAGSDSGQFDSSWWQKITFWRIAFETPSCEGISSSRAAHFVESVCRFCSANSGKRREVRRQQQVLTRAHRAVWLLGKRPSGFVERGRRIKKGINETYLPVYILLIGITYRSFESLHTQSTGSLLLRNLQSSFDKHLLPSSVVEPEFDLSFHFGRSGDLWQE